MNGWPFCDSRRPPLLHRSLGCNREYEPLRRVREGFSDWHAISLLAVGHIHRSLGCNREYEPLRRVREGFSDWHAISLLAVGHIHRSLGCNREYEPLRRVREGFSDWNAISLLAVGHIHRSLGCNPRKTVPKPPHPEGVPHHSREIHRAQLLNAVVRAPDLFHEEPPASSPFRYSNAGTRISGHART